MKKFVFALLLFMMFSSCCVDKELECAFDDIPQEVFELKNEEQIVYWVYKNIKYIDDKKGRDKWQTPEETLLLKTGDCEDMTILTMYLIHKVLGYKCEFMAVHMFENKKNLGKHATAVNGNKFYDPTYMMDGILANPEVYSYKEIYRKDYDFIMFITVK